MTSKRDRRIELVVAASGDLSPGADGVTEVVRDIAAQAGCSERTVFRDIEALRAGSLDDDRTQGLDDKQLAAFLRTLNASQAWRELGGADGTGMTLRTFQRRVRQSVPGRIDAGLRRGVPGTFATTIVAPRLATVPNERWEIDTKRLDVTVVGDDGEEVSAVNFVAILDHATRVIVDWGVVYAAVTATDVRRVLTRAMLGHVVNSVLIGGIPDAVVTDQGADYTSKEVQRLTDAVRCVLDPLPPYHPHLKGTVERSFSTLDMQWTRSLPGHKGKALRADESVIRDDRAMHAEDLEASLSAWVDDYHRREHSGIGQSPLDAWREAAPTLTIPTVDQVLPFLEDHHRRTVTNRGVRIGNRFFKCGELGDHMGRELEVRTLAGARVADVFHGNRHVGRAIAEDDWTESDLHRLLGERKTTTKAVKELRVRRDSARQTATPSTTRPTAPSSGDDTKRSRLLPRGTGLDALKRRADTTPTIEQLELT